MISLGRNLVGDILYAVTLVVTLNTLRKRWGITQSPLSLPPGVRARWWVLLAVCLCPAAITLTLVEHSWLWWPGEALYGAFAGWCMARLLRWWSMASERRP